MKIWLNSILACPDDKAYPLKLKIFEWNTLEDIFAKLVRAYSNKYLINFKNEKDLREINVFDKENACQADYKPKDANIVHNENKRLTLDMDFPNIISIFIENRILKVKDFNVVTPVSIKEYFKSYSNFLKEFQEITDESDESNNKHANKLYAIVKNEVSQKILHFINNESLSEYDNIKDSDEKLIVNSLMEKIQPIFQELLLLNYYFFIMEINEALLICPKCKRWYPVIQSIPRLFPKTMARQEMDIAFKEKWMSKYPKDAI
jgi:uncharacterized protein YbaR (Trm112 family)